MANGYLATEYPISGTGVTFSCEDAVLQGVFEDCERLAKENIRMFGEYRVLQEGAKYNGVWYETQPMGGEMYASRDMEAALNNHLIFLLYQRRDGKMPGMIRYSFPWNGISPHHDWMQGDFFTKSALRMYWWIGKDRKYLELLYKGLRDFENYLWSCRDSDGDGCLESWGVWDTGEDNCSRIMANGVKYPEEGAHTGETAPCGETGFPFESAEYMAYSYAHCLALAEISDLLGLGERAEWLKRAETVQNRAKEYLWVEEKKAFFDRDCKNEIIDCLTLENIKCMYHGLMTQEMADDFIAQHLMNPEEFCTPLPMAYIAIHDPLFYVNDEVNNFSEELKARHILSEDAADNNWSGPVEGLTMQRSVDALLGYGHHAEASWFGRKWLENLKKYRSYVQQYNPFTGEPAPGDQGYGPTVLAALEYITWLYGVDYGKDELVFSCSAEDFESEYSQSLFGHVYTLKRQGGKAVVLLDGVEKLRASLGARIVTDMDCRVKRVSGMESGAREFVLTAEGVQHRIELRGNMTAEFDGGFGDVTQVRCEV